MLRQMGENLSFAWIWVSIGDSNKIRNILDPHIHPGHLRSWRGQRYFELHVKSLEKICVVCGAIIQYFLFYFGFLHAMATQCSRAVKHCRIKRVVGTLFAESTERVQRLLGNQTGTKTYWLAFTFGVNAITPCLDNLGRICKASDVVA